LIWIELILIGWKNGKVVLCKRAKFSWPVSGWPSSAEQSKGARPTAALTAAWPAPACQQWGR
jgi:hypothetical protein